MNYKAAIRKITEHFFRKHIRGQVGINQNRTKIKNAMKKKNIWLLGIPASRNLGDQAQVMCSERLFERFFPDYSVIELDSNEILASGGQIAKYIGDHITPNDIVFFQSGYNLTDMYPFQEIMHREIVSRVTNPVVFLPQTISLQEPYDKNEFITESKRAYKGKNILLMCRDKYSLGIADKAFPEIKKVAFPDVVTSMIGYYDSKKTREGYAFCVRNDVEGNLTADDVMRISTFLSSRGKTAVFDSIIESPAYFIVNKNRKKYVEELIRRLQSVRVVITDKYHGFILSVVANTPVIILKTKDHKLTEGIKWFPEEMQKYIRVAEKIEDIPQIIDELEQLGIPAFSTYFEDHYFSHFREIIEESILL